MPGGECARTWQAGQGVSSALEHRLHHIMEGISLSCVSPTRIQPCNRLDRVPPGIREEAVSSRSVAPPQQDESMEESMVVVGTCIVEGIPPRNGELRCFGYHVRAHHCRAFGM